MGPNSQLLLTAYEAWNRDDCDAWLEMLDPDIRIETSGVFPDLSPQYRGHEGARKFWGQLHDPWEEFRIDVEQVEERGDCATGAIRFRAVGSDSGVRVDMRFCNAIRVRNGRATELLNRRTVEEAREALRPASAAASDRLR
jgi:ketosteroid isomerase-like protein